VLTLLPASRSPANSETLAPPARIEGRPVSNWLRSYLSGLPDIDGSPIYLQFLPELTAHRGKLFTGEPERGRAVHPASFLRERRIVLEDTLIENPSLLRLLLTHEIFHFVWIRLSNESRRNFEQALLREQRSHVTGELGESSAVARELLRTGDEARRSLRWRGYVCESFCDTAAWAYGGMKRYRYFRLAAEWRTRRAAVLSNIRVSRA
jgi:hypothetical protein